MPSAKVTIRELTLDTRVPTFPGVYTAILIPAPKGPLTPYLITSDTQLLKIFTPDESIKVGYDSAFFSALAALEKSNSVWIRRVTNAPLYGGVTIESSDSTDVSASYALGESTPEDDHVFGTNEVFAIYGANPGVWNDNISITIRNYRASEVFTADDVTDQLTIAQYWATGLPVLVNSTGTLPAPLAKNTTYYTIKVSATEIKLATSLANALVGAAIDITDTGTGIHTINLVENLSKEQYLFYIEVFKGTTRVEYWTCSRKEMKDGFGVNVFIEDVLEGSNYIRALNNVLIADTVLPQDQVSALSLAGGSDGSAVSDAHMLTALEDFENANDIPITLLLDGGWTTVPYQKQGLIATAESRMDCFAILSTPYSTEVSSDYLNELVEYRRNTLNVNSSYGGLYSPHVKIYDKYNDRRIFVPPDGYAAAQISETAANRELWFPAAGYNRGMLEVLDVAKRFSEGELDYLYDNEINPIKFVPGKGIVIWGQRTLSATPGHLQNMSVRMMLLVIEPAIKVALENFLWEFNTSETRATARILISSYLDLIQSRDGIAAHEVICDDTNNSPEDIDAGYMNIWVLITPVVPVEQIPVTVALVKTGTSFTTAIQALT